MKTLILKCPKPRNPLALAGRQRKAGSHAARNRPRRQATKLALRAELKHLHSPPC